MDAYEALVNNGLDWYVVETIEGDLRLQHSTALSAILDCGRDPEEYGITGIHQCWNGVELGESPFDDGAEIVD